MAQITHSSHIKLLLVLLNTMRLTVSTGDAQNSGEKLNYSENKNKNDSEGSEEATRELRKPGPQERDISLSYVSVAEFHPSHLRKARNHSLRLRFEKYCEVLVAAG